MSHCTRVVCSCGIVLQQCRCPAPKKDVVSPEPCVHKPKE